MKNAPSTISKSILLLVLLTTTLFASARTSFNIKNSDDKTVTFSVAIPAEWNANIIREEQDGNVTFKFKGTDGSLSFLFSVNKVSETTWGNIYEQLGHFKVLEHKNGIVYYSQCTDKSNLKGADGDLYSKIYASLNDIIKSVHITE